MLLFTGLMFLQEKNFLGILLNLLGYYRRNKGMGIYGYRIIANHIHLVFRSTNGDSSGLIRDFKDFTSRNMLKTMKITHKKVEKNGGFECLKELERKTIT